MGLCRCSYSQQATAFPLFTKKADIRCCELCPLWVKSRHVQCKTACSGHVRCNSVCPLCANSGHSPTRPLKQKDRLVAVSPKSDHRFDQAVACAFRLLRQPSRPNAPRPVAKSGSAPGKSPSKKDVALAAVLAATTNAAMPNIAVERLNFCDFTGAPRYEISSKTVTQLKRERQMLPFGQTRCL